MLGLMGCLFSKQGGDQHLLSLEEPGSGSPASTPPCTVVPAQPRQQQVTAATTSPLSSGTPQSDAVLKPSSRAGFAEISREITAGMEQQLGSWKAPLDKSVEGGRAYLTNSNIHKLSVGGVIGKGNYGIVHRGEWNGRNVAVKKMILPKGLPAHQQAQLIEDFKCEVDICCRLKHPRLVDFVGYSTSPSLCIVQEWMELGSLYDLFTTGWRGCIGPASDTAAVRQQLVLALDVARGMAYLHAWRPPLIHRDLKSLNLLISSGSNDKSGSNASVCGVSVLVVLLVHLALFDVCRMTFAGTGEM